MNTQIDNSTAIFIVIAIIIFLYVTYKRYQKRCSTCRKWNALSEIDRKRESRENISIKKTSKSEGRNSQNKVTYTHYKDVYVPGYKDTYLVTYQCKYCKNPVTKEEILRHEV